MEEAFDPEKHEIKFNVNLGRGIEVDTNKIEMQKVPAPVKTPLVFSVFDRFSETTDSELSVNGTIEIIGKDLKVNTDAADEGVFFIDSNNAEVKASRFYSNTDKELQVRVPELLTGGYKIEIRKRYGSAKKLYKHSFIPELTVR
jgi:hypothetical protein